MSKKPRDNSPFEGFEQANTTPVPDVLFDELLDQLTGTELKVLLYIIRRTRGFKKESDAISLTQFQYGITTKDGRQLDKGCGIKRRQTIVDALISLEEKGYIVSHKEKTSENDNATTVYRIHFKGVVSKPDYPQSQEGSFKTGLPSFNNGLGVVAQTGLPVVSKSDPQETVIQETVIQERKNEGTSESDSSTPSLSLIANTDTENLESKATGNASTQRNTEPLTPQPDPEASRVFNLLCEVFYAIPPDVITEKIKKQCLALAPHVRNAEDLQSLRDYARAEIMDDPSYKKKQVHLGNLVSFVNGWKQKREPLPEKTAKPKRQSSQLEELKAIRARVMAEAQAGVN